MSRRAIGSSATTSSRLSGGSASNRSRVLRTGSGQRSPRASMTSTGGSWASGFIFSEYISELAVRRWRPIFASGTAEVEVMRRVFLMAFAAALLASFGCSSDADSVTGTTPNVHGTWTAAMTTTGGTQAPSGTQFTVTFELVQAGADVVGTYSTEGGATGIVTGTISGSTVSLSATQSPPCDGTYDTVATMNPASTSMSGTYSGSDCFGTLDATFTAAKQ